MMIESFKELVNRAMRDQGMSHMRAVIEKELLHYDIMFALDQGGLLSKLTFQGGTCLRLCHGAPRFSEDLDFTGGYDFDRKNLNEIKQCVEDYLGARYGLHVKVKEPKQIQAEPGVISVAKWQISLQTAPERRDLPQQHIKLEVANLPSHTREPLALKRNYEFLPDGYVDTLVMAQNLDEIMADKIVSLVNCHKYVRHRDIWDLRWLQQQGAMPDIEMIKSKIDDYEADDYLDYLHSTIDNLPKIIASTDFKQEMKRFLPLTVQGRTLDRTGFDQFLADSVGQLLSEVGQMLEAPGERRDETTKFTL